MWWEFAYHGDAPRFLRASIGVAIAVLATLAYRFLHRSRPPSVPPSVEDLNKAAAIVAQSERTQSMLALLGDKQFLFNKDGSGFVMYGTQGDSWIAMGDPIVSRDEDTAGLIWQFKELVNLEFGVPAFYEISSLNLPVFLDAGFSMVKLGEEALVDLERFSLDGPEHKKLRYAVSKFERIRASFEVVAARDVAQLLPELRAASRTAGLQTWIRRRRGFRLATGPTTSMLRHDAAVVRVNGNVVAFTNLWRSANLNEASIDIMRVTPDAPNGQWITSSLRSFCISKARDSVGSIWAWLHCRGYRPTDWLRCGAGWRVGCPGMVIASTSLRVCERTKASSNLSGAPAISPILAGSLTSADSRRCCGIGRDVSRESADQKDTPMSPACLRPVAMAFILVVCWNARVEAQQRTVTVKQDVLGSIEIVAPQAEPSRFVIFISDHDGLTPARFLEAQKLTDRGAAVALIDLPKLQATFAKRADDDCCYVFGEFEDLARMAQKQLNVSDWKWPELLGVGDGGTLAYLSLAQAPSNTAGGAVSIGFFSDIFGQGTAMRRSGRAVEEERCRRILANDRASGILGACSAGRTVKGGRILCRRFEGGQRSRGWRRCGKAVRRGGLTPLQHEAKGERRALGFADYRASGFGPEFDVADPAVW